MCETLFGQARECKFAEPPLPTGWEPLPQKVNCSDSASKAGYHFHVNLQSYLHVAIQIIMVSEVDADNWDTFCCRSNPCACYIMLNTTALFSCKFFIIPLGTV